MAPSRIWLALIISVCTFLPAGYGQESSLRTTYFVRGKTAKNGQITSESYPTRKRALEELEAWKTERSPDGLIPDDPFIEGPDIYSETSGTVKKEQVSNAPDKAPVRPGVTGEGPNLFKGVQDKMAAERVGQLSVAGKKATGILGKYKVTMAFNGAGNTGDVVISGDAAAQGKWTQNGSELTMETATFTYRAKVENGKITGFQFQKKPALENTPAVEWNMTIQEPVVKPKEVPLKGPFRAYLWQDNKRVQPWNQTFETAEEAINEARRSWDSWKTEKNNVVRGTVATDGSGRAIATFGQGR